MEQRLRMRALEEFFGSFCSFFCAAKNSTSEVAGLARIAFSSARWAANLATRRMRFLLRSMAEVLGMGKSRFSNFDSRFRKVRRWDLRLVWPGIRDSRFENRD